MGWKGQTVPSNTRNHCIAQTVLYRLTQGQVGPCKKVFSHRFRDKRVKTNPTSWVGNWLFPALLATFVAWGPNNLGKVTDCSSALCRNKLFSHHVWAVAFY